MPTIGAPIQGYYYDQPTDTLRPYASAVGASQFGVTFVGDATANVTLTSMAAAEDYFNASVRYANRVDLAGYSQCRLVARRMTIAGAASSVLTLKFSTTNPAATFSAGAWTTSGVQISLVATAQTIDSGWVSMPSAMCVNDIYIALTQSGGDGSASPILGGVWVYFRALGPLPVVTESDYPKGIVAYKRDGAGGFVSLTTTQTEIWRLTNVPLKTGRLYKFTMTSRAINRSAQGNVAIHTQGSTAIIGTTLVVDCLVVCDSNYATFHWSENFTVANDGTFTLIIYANTTASGTGVIYTDAASGVSIEDIGPNRGLQ